MRKNVIITFELIKLLFQKSESTYWVKVCIDLGICLGNVINCKKQSLKKQVQDDPVLLKQIFFFS